LLPFLATKSNVASTLSLVWTGLNDLIATYNSGVVSMDISASLTPTRKVMDGYVFENEIVWVFHKEH